MGKDVKLHYQIRKLPVLDKRDRTNSFERDYSSTLNLTQPNVSSSDDEELDFAGVLGDGY